MARTLLCLLLLAFASGLSAFESGRASFSVRVNDELIPYREFAIYVLPREAVVLEAVASRDSPFRVVAPGGAQALGARRWSWTAPAMPGLHRIEIADADDAINLNVFVMHPATSLREGYLNDFRVGSYPATPLNDNPIYLPPDGFIELTEDNAGVSVSPHFRLSQFPAKQAGGYPKFLVLREQLLLKLELLLERVNELGIAAAGLTVMSGYRTPFYNQAIGNGRYSRHIYGGAADIYIDVDPVDDVMDDINGDGALDYRDAQMLYDIAERLYALPENRWLIGGLGVYRRNSAHGPFLHVDARGFRSRWGLIP